MSAPDQFWTLTTIDRGGGTMAERLQFAFFIAAPSEDEARLVAGRLWAKEEAGRDLLESPWLDPELVSCAWNGPVDDGEDVSELESG
jgi:hypothetical protein